ncbi:MAG: hypothetical protein K2I87_02760 [Bacteroidales bacterium]|nr:hypothetical protein [Bacteroidales bacterium]
MIKTARDLFAGNIQAQAQVVAENENLPDAPKIFKKDCLIDFNLPAKKVLQQIKALSPYPGAIACLQQFSTQKSIPIKLLDAVLDLENTKSYEQGAILSDNKKFMRIVCGDGFSVAIIKLQLPGKKQLTIEEFLRGFRLSAEKDLFTFGVINNQQGEKVGYQRS